jgi:hypothetical protein
MRMCKLDGSIPPSKACEADHRWDIIELKGFDEAVREGALAAVADLAHVEDFRKAHPEIQWKANLGLATTGELLQELVARGDVEMVANPGTPEGQQGAILSGTAMGLMRALDLIINYRTADSE